MPIDCQNAFERVHHHKGVKIPKDFGLGAKNLRNYWQWNQMAYIKIEKEFSEAISVQLGVRQKCVLSPLLF